MYYKKCIDENGSVFTDEMFQWMVLFITIYYYTHIYDIQSVCIDTVFNLRIYIKCMALCGPCWHASACLSMQIIHTNVYRQYIPGNSTRLDYRVYIVSLFGST